MQNVRSGTQTFQWRLHQSMHAYYLQKLHRRGRAMPCVLPGGKEV